MIRNISSWSVSMAVLALAGLLAVACSSTDNKSKDDESARAKGLAKSLAEFSYPKLASFDAALKVISEHVPRDADDTDPGLAIIGCSVSKTQAIEWRARLRPHLERELIHERDVFSLDPRNYSASFSFCAQTCTCGALVEVVTGAGAVPDKRDRVMVARAVVNMRRKDKALGPIARRQCARDQGPVLCRPEIRAELEGASPSTGVPAPRG